MNPLAIGQPLPTLPLWIADELRGTAGAGAELRGDVPHPPHPIDPRRRAQVSPIRPGDWRATAAPPASDWSGGTGHPSASAIARSSSPSSRVTRPSAPIHAAQALRICRLSCGAAASSSSKARSSASRSRLRGGRMESIPGQPSAWIPRAKAWAASEGGALPMWARAPRTCRTGSDQEVRRLDEARGVGANAEVRGQVAEDEPVQGVFVEAHLVVRLDQLADAGRERLELIAREPPQGRDDHRDQGQAQLGRQADAPSAGSCSTTRTSSGSAFAASRSSCAACTASDSLSTSRAKTIARAPKGS